MCTRTAQDWTRRSRKERRFMPMKRKAVRQTRTKKLAQMSTVAMRTPRTLREQIGIIMIASQAIAVMISGRLGTIHSIITLRNVAQLKILTGRIWPQKPRILLVARGLATDKVLIPIPPSRQVPSYYRVPTDHPRNLFLLQRDDHVLRWRKERQSTPNHQTWVRSCSGLKHVNFINAVGNETAWRNTQSFCLQ